MGEKKKPTKPRTRFCCCHNLNGQENKSKEPMAGLEMLSGPFGRKGEDEVMGLFKQLQ